MEQNIPALVRRLPTPPPPRSQAMSRRAAKLFFWPMLPVTYLHRRNALWTRVDDSVLVGVAPVAFSVTPANLKRMGVKGVVNLCDEFMGPTRSYAQLQMQELRLPVVDHFEPSVADLQKAVDFIERVTKDGSAVYVHCKAVCGEPHTTTTTATPITATGKLRCPCLCVCVCVCACLCPCPCLCVCLCL